MKLSLTFKLATSYLVLMVCLIIWIMTKSGDTPIGPALLTLLPWGFVFFESFKSMPEFVLPAVNIGLNTILLYVIGKILGRLNRNNTQSLPYTKI